VSDRNERFITMCQQANILITEDIENGEVIDVVVRKSAHSWAISLMFPKVIKMESLAALEEKLPKFFVDGKDIHHLYVRYAYENPSVSEDDFEKIFRYAVRTCGKDKASIVIFEEYRKEYSESEIKVFVPNENEENMLKESEEVLKIFLTRIGFPKIKITYGECTFTPSITEKIERNERLVREAAEKEIIDRSMKQVGTPKNGNGSNGQAVYGPRRRKPASNKVLAISEIPATANGVLEFKQIHDTDKVEIEGEIIEFSFNKAKSYLIYQAILTDGFDSIIIKRFVDKAMQNYFEDYATVGKRVKVYGVVVYDTYARDVVVSIDELVSYGDFQRKIRKDSAPVKRVELHAHTKMSIQDSVLDVVDYVKRAAAFGHSAVAVTDHGNVHALPELASAAKQHGVKPIFGVEANLIDEHNYKIAFTDEDINLHDATYVIYDIETTGLSSNYHEIIEIGAVKMSRGIEVERFSELIKPSRPISALITEITGITDEDVAHARNIKEVLKEFVAFIDGAVLVAHNASFDNSHLYYHMKKYGLFEKEFPTIDTLQFARVVYNEKMKLFGLKYVAKALKVELEQHHRALSDAKTTANIFMKMLGDVHDFNITNYGMINTIIKPDEAYKYVIPKHIVILVKNQKGLKNLNKIISDSHTDHFYKEPRVLKSFLEAHREGLLIGSGCASGDIFITAYEKSTEELKEKAKFYDYLEVQPPKSYYHLVEESGEEITKTFINETIQKIIKVGDELGIPVVATGDIHHLEEEDIKYRQIYFTSLRTGGGRHELADIKNAPSKFYMTTDEMLKEFQFLGKDKAEELVVTNSNLIANQIEKFDLFPKQLFAPRDDFLKEKFGIPSMAEAVKAMSYQNASNKYGEQLPEFIKDRLETELKSIIGNNYASVYYISHMLVKKSNDEGYIVGSRGSVGSSYVATAMNITEVNPLPPHYHCPKCHFTAFKLNKEEKQKYYQFITPEIESALEEVEVGYDLQELNCPTCSAPMQKDGVDIPFETFLGFEGDKVPDIDLNFSGEYQEKAHEFTREIFGVDHAFRAGTIGTVADRTAYGYVRGYLEEKGIDAREAEIKRLASKITGVKRSTGQHPGGIIVIPDDIEYSDIIPVQYPADDVGSNWRTSHYDYHSFESNLLKLDILGHDDPTVIRHLMNFVEAHPEEFDFHTVEDIPLADKEVLKLFSSTESIGLTPDQVNNSVVSTAGIPEFGTTFVRGLLSDTLPKSVSELIKVSGLSHGTDVWIGNAKELVLGNNPLYGKIPFKEVIGCRDDIMVYLMNKNLPPKLSFQIMESVRKGRGLSLEQEKEMMKYNIPHWYIDSCKKIKYMFPKAHATAYVIMALRIGWFKVYKPLYYYAAFFSRRAPAFDPEILAAGKLAIKNKMTEIEENKQARKSTPKEEDLFITLEVALEMVQRGFRFKQIDIEKSDSHFFIINQEEKSLLLPFRTMDSLGDAVATSIVEARNQLPFTSKADVGKRTRINTTLMEKLDRLGAFGKLPDKESNQLFKF